MQKSFRFTNASIKALPANTDTRSTELEVSDTEVIGLKCLSGRTGNKRFEPPRESWRLNFLRKR